MTQQNPELSSGGNEARVRASKRQAAKRRATRNVKKIDGESSNLPPLKQKSTALVLKHYRLRILDVEQTQAVVNQRQTDTNDVVRKQYERGVNVDSALGAPSEDGLYGLYRGPRLAELLRPDIDGLISFALNQGVVPTIVQEYRGMIVGMSETLQRLRSQLAALPTVPAAYSVTSIQVPPQQQEAVTEVADEAASVFGMFGLS